MREKTREEKNSSADDVVYLHQKVVKDRLRMVHEFLLVDDPVVEVLSQCVQESKLSHRQMCCSWCLKGKRNCVVSQRQLRFSRGKCSRDPEWPCIFLRASVREQESDALCEMTRRQLEAQSYSAGGD